MPRYLRLYKKMIGFSVAQVTVYRVSFAIFSGWLLVETLIRVMFFSAIYTQVDTIGDWTFVDCFLLVMFHGLMYDFAWMLFLSGFSKFQDTFSRGDFDFVLLKPINSLAYLTITGFNAGSFSGARFPLLAYAIFFLPIIWHWPLVLAAIVVFFLGLIALHGIFTILSSLCFWITEAESVFNFSFHLVEGGRYPISIYPLALRFVFTFIVPILLIANFPVMMIQGMIGYQALLIALAAAIFLQIAAYTAWSLGTKHYSSASS